MQIKSFFLLIFSLFSLSTMSQNDYIPEKSELISEEVYKKYSDVLKKSFSVNEADREYTNIAISYAYLKADSSYVFSNLSKALEKDSATLCEYIDVIGNRFNLKVFKEIDPIAWDNFCSICKDYNRRHPEEEILPSSDLEIKLSEIRKRDKMYRTLIRMKENKNETDSIDYYWSLQRKNDTLNFKAISLIFEEYGYPGKSQVHESFMNIACIVMQHTPLEIKEKHIKMLHDAAVAGEFRASTYIHLIDKLHFQKFGTQLYHTQRYKAKGESEYRPIDMEDEEGFEQRNKDWKNRIFHYGRLMELESFKRL